MMLSDFGILVEYWPDIVNGIWLTFVVWVGGMGFGMLLGLAFAPVQFKVPVPLAWIVIGINTVLRGVPFLNHLFLFYYGGPFVGIVLDPLPAGILALSVYSAAYFS